jgi:sulfopyruvate decarboxylase TPP-binding subunit
MNFYFPPIQFPQLPCKNVDNLLKTLNEESESKLASGYCKR